MWAVHGLIVVNDGHNPSMHSRGRLFVRIGIAVWILCTGVYMSGWLDRMEHHFVDIRARWLEPYHDYSDDIVMVFIDDESLSQMAESLGRWPWPRSIYADMVRYIHAGGAKAQVFDLLFFEAQMDRRITGDESPDMLFATAADDAGNVYQASQIGYDERPIFLPIPVLEQSAKGIGFVNVEPDVDGVVRQVATSHGTNVSLPMAVYMGEYPNQPIQNHIKNTMVVNVKRSFPTISAGALLQSIQAIQRGDIHDVTVFPSEFTNKIVFIGASAVATHDQVNTSIQSNMPGMYIHASALDNLILRDYFTHAFIGWELLGASILMLWIGYGLCIGERVITYVMSVLLGLGTWLGLSVGLMANTIIIGVAYPITCCMGMTGICIGYIAVTEGKERRKMRKMLSKYVSPIVLADVMDKSNAPLIPEVGEEQLLTIFFSDIRGFTDISEQVPSDQLVRWLNDYLETMVGIIFEANGTLDKFIGDAIMAFWGAPLASNTHAKDAVLAALKMVEKENELSKSTMNTMPFKTGIGIHTGRVILGNIGSSQQLDYTIIGDNVNIASRIEGATKQYNVPLLVSNATYSAVGNDVLMRPVDRVQFKGKREAIQLFQPLGDLATISNTQRSIAHDTTIGWQHYMRHEWSLALRAYQSVLTIDTTDTVARRMIDRIQGLLNHPPKNDSFLG